MAAVYHLDPNPTQAALRAIAANWRPYRTWTALLLRTWLEDVLPDRINPNRSHDTT
jgi:3-methyladenine DNA glycosylase/8-oxoguanine DNA glycosylase